MSFNPSRFQEFWLLFPLVVPVLWVGGCFLVSCMGWRWFARKYPVRVRPPGQVHRVPTVKFEFVGMYRDSVRVVFVPEGIYISAPWLYRPFHAPFLLPWGSVGRIRKKAGFRQRGRGLIVEVEDEEGPIRLWLSKEMEEDFFKHYRSKKPAPTARRAFPKGQTQVQAVAQPPTQETREAGAVGATASGVQSAHANANPGVGTGVDADAKTNPSASASAMAGTFASPFTIVGMGLPVPGSSGPAAQAPVPPQVQMGGPVFAYTPVDAVAAATAPVAVVAAAPAATVVPVPMPMPMPMAIRSVFVPISEPGPVPMSLPAPVPVSTLTTITATATASASAATMMAESRS